ncbi:MAG: hypothetical protein NT025_05355 [bacterium]|nr:hypothetical protein [bacterium]
MKLTTFARFRTSFRCAVCVLAAILFVGHGYADSPYTLSVAKGGVPGSECRKYESARVNDYLVGMVGTIVVIVDYPDSIVMPYRGVQTFTWPAGLTLEASISNDAASVNFEPSSSVLAQLNLHYFVQRDQANRDSLWRHAGMKVNNKLDIRPVFWFHHDVLPEWAGKHLCFRAVYESPTFGKLVSGVTCFTVSMPCSKADSDNVNLGNVVAAGWEQDYARAMALVDSLFAAGWVDRRALGYVGVWAIIQHRYDDRLRCLDIEFQHYGNIGASHGEEVTPVTPESRAEYDRYRQEALRAKAAYEAQQR